MSSPIPKEAVFSVSEFLEFINQMLKPLRVTVQGEITSLKVRNGHTYFSITDPQENAKLDCILWRYKHKSLDFKLEEGAEIKLIGTPNMYKPFGKFSFIVDYASPVGEGALKKAFEKLKKRLEEAGFFAPERKQDLPTYPQKIGLITSARGDAIKDFKTHLGEYGYRLYHYDVTVEGVNAIDSIVEAIEWFNKQPQAVEVIVVTRGGGSLESLQAFNSEPVAQAIYASKIPVLSAIGHENDLTISDLVADVRGSTPTDAGKILSQQWCEAKNILKQSEQLMLQQWWSNFQRSQQALRYHQFHVFSKAQELITVYQRRIDNYQQNLVRFITLQLSNFEHQIAAWRQNMNTWQRSYNFHQEKLAVYTQQLQSLFQQLLKQADRQIKQQELQLKLSDPQRKLKQGYSIARLASGEVVRQLKQVQPGLALEVQIHQGTIKTKIQEVQHESEK